MERIASDGGQLVDWLIVRVFYCVADFTMLNTVNLGRFVTLTLWCLVTPQETIFLDVCVTQYPRGL